MHLKDGTIFTQIWMASYLHRGLSSHLSSWDSTCLTSSARQAAENKDLSGSKAVLIQLHNCDTVIIDLMCYFLMTWCSSIYFHVRTSKWAVWILYRENDCKRQHNSWDEKYRLDWKPECPFTLASDSQLSLLLLYNLKPIRRCNMTARLHLPW